MRVPVRVNFVRTRVGIGDNRTFSEQGKRLLTAEHLLSIGRRGAAVAWNLAAMHPTKFPRVCAMSVPRTIQKGGIGFTVDSLKKAFNWKEGAAQAEGFFYM